MIVKGKRTKRQVPISATAATNSGSNCNYVSSTATSSAQSSAESTCTEEEDMANCLILLAQGRRSQQRGVFVYQCKTCDRCFSSFQALGGHRASHKKPRIAGGEGEGGEIVNTAAVNDNHNLPTTTAAVKPSKVHECAICGAGFSSGQAGADRRQKRIGIGSQSAGAGSRGGREGTD
ncbi:unnamed protein product [Linum tenue]|uniref:C2H2-type domain-containing protein n=1 Tax=Linum tenue TaxID=586396 RepID=A0AAV0PDR3_9ROSI|nr:unnamed protein product [Linum tenue]